MYADTPFSAEPFSALPAGGNPNLVGAAATFTLSGQDVALRMVRQLAPAAATFTLSGQDAALRMVRRGSRGLDAGTVAALGAALVRPVVLFEGVFATGTARLWSGTGDLVWSGNTFQGVGTLGGIGAVQETQEVRAAGTTVSLSGIPSELVSLALQSLRQNRSGKIWLAFLPAEGAELLATEALDVLLTEAGEPLAALDERDLLGEPVLLFDGRLDTGTIEDGGDRSAIVLAYESRLIDLERARERRYTDEDQRIDYPDDAGFAFVASLQDQVFTWGRG